MKIALAFTLAAATLCGALAPALAQSEDAKQKIAALKPAGFPSQPIEINVVYPAGGGMDLNARLVGKFFEKWTGNTAIVNNRTGGAGLVGHTFLATQAENDGHTVGVIANLMFADAMLRAQNRWKYTDLEPIAYLNSDGQIGRAHV